MDAQHRETFGSNEKWNIFFAHALLIVMMACTAITLERVFLYVLRDLSMSYLPWVGLLAALEALLSFRLTRSMAFLGRRRWLYRAAEWVVLVFGLWVGVELRAGGAHLAETLSGWPGNFLETFFTREYFSALFVLVIIWGISFLYAVDLYELEGDDYLFSQAGQDGVPSNRRGIHQQLAERTLVIGAAIALLEGGIRQSYWTLPGLQPLAQGSAFQVIAYFVLGMAFLAQTNFAAWRAAWGYQRVTIHGNIAVPWTAYSLGFLGILCLLAWVLPTQYALGFFPTIDFLLRLLGTVVAFLIYLFMLPILFLISVWERLFGVSPQSLPQENPPSLGQPAGDVAALASIPWWEALKSALFWLLAADEPGQFPPRSGPASSRRSAGRMAPVALAGRGSLCGELLQPAPVISPPASIVLLPGFSPTRGPIRRGAPALANAPGICRFNLRASPGQRP